jgi:diaminohydroxyphosphoribosylaminopyrimidine deaminase/5-amino-6-(5-phosphoribosylamino)uracil reductase
VRVAGDAEVAAMRRAVQLSARGLPTAHPNPVVGAVVLGPDGSTTVGEGWHERAGGPHAEVRALAAAGERARGGTVVVTLEPCAHIGRTGPCTAALLAAGVRRVVVAVTDPHPVAGGGAEVLRAAGVEVETGVLAGEAAAVNEDWLIAVRRGRPLVTWKYAATLDGRVAAADGSSRWITSAPARADVHRLRGAQDAIIVGVGTVLADDPHLTVRHPNGELAALQPLRVVVDSAGRTPAGARVLDNAAPTLLAVGEGAAPPVGAEVVRLPAAADGRGLDLTALLSALTARDRRFVLLEGGPTLAGGFLDAGLVDRVVGYVAPALLGRGPVAVTTSRTGATMEDVRRWRLEGVQRIGPDVRLTARTLEEV